MLSNYPPGVTGYEAEIAGPDWEDFDYPVACDCGFFGDVYAWGFRGVTHWECPKCHTEQAIEVDADDDFDYPVFDDEPPTNWEP